MSRKLVHEKSDAEKVAESQLSFRRKERLEEEEEPENPGSEDEVLVLQHSRDDGLGNKVRSQCPDQPGKSGKRGRSNNGVQNYPP